jgi:phytoene dehydrogenase-like protein
MSRRIHGETDVVVVGAGLSGLAAALRLETAGLSCRLLEAGDGIGGRVRTDRTGGFLLDRGFQVFLEAYPEAKRVLDYDRLRLSSFHPGAKVWRNGGLHAVSDPFRQPLAALSGMVTPVGTLLDKMRILVLRREALAHEPFAGEEITTLEALQVVGFSDEMVDALFRPFLGGIFLDDSLETSSYMLDFVFSMMAEGPISLPAAGMGAITEQLAQRLRRTEIHLGSCVESVTPDSVTLESGETFGAPAVVVALDGPSARDLLGAEIPEVPSRSTACLYFAARETPVDGPWLVLNGESSEGVQNLAVLDQVAPGYAPPGSHLVSATVLDDTGAHGESDARLQGRVREQLTEWFGRAVAGWQHLSTYRIPHALPGQPPGFRRRGEAGPRHDLGGGPVYLAGDWLTHGSIQGALVSGREAAEALLADRD